MGLDAKKLAQPLSPVVFPGGETEALARMERHCTRTSWVAKFEKPLTSPNALEPSITVGDVSCYLLFLSFSFFTLSYFPQFPSFLFHFLLFFVFLDASSHLYMRVCPSVRPSVHVSVCPYVR